MAVPEQPRRTRRRVSPRRLGALTALVVFVGLLAFAVSRLDVHRFGHALITATPGWVALALLLMGLSLVLRSASWHQVLRAALPDTPIHWPPVVRATMIGVMASAVLPGRIGEPSRVIVLTRRLDGPTRRLLPIITGTVFSQTLINLLALAMLAGITFTGVPLLHGHILGILTAVLVPLGSSRSCSLGPRLLAGVALALASTGACRRDDRAEPAPGAPGAGRVRPSALRLDGGPPATGGLGAAVAGLLHGACSRSACRSCQPRRPPPPCCWR